MFARLLLATAALLTFSASAKSTDWHVSITACPTVGSGTTADPFCQIQSGIDAATDGDTVIVAPGQYFENIHLSGKNITLRSNDPANPAVVAATIIDGSQALEPLSSSTVDFSGSEGPTCVLDGMTITGGTGSEHFLTENGGSGGGGIMGRKTHATVRRCHIFGNGKIFETTEGGGIAFVNGHIDACIVEGNIAKIGGGIYGCNGLLSSNIIRSNISHEGAGAGIAHSNGTISQCLIESNMIDEGSRGGGLYECTGLVIGSIIRRNTACLDGAGISTQSGTYVNCLIAGNVSDLDGSGAGAFSPHAVFINCTFVGNRSTYGNNVDAATINSVRWNNLVEGVIEEAPNPMLSGCGGDPLFVDELGPDGISGTDDDDVRLSDASPCINRGDPATIVAPGDTDLAGNPRRVGCRVDMGALESDVDQMSGDFDGNTRIDLQDIASFQLCYDAPAGNEPWANACLCVFDYDLGGAIDLTDHAMLQAALTGP